MKLLLAFITGLVGIIANPSQLDFNYQDGEMLKYRIHYGILNAGFATLTIRDTNLNGKPHFHIVGQGSSSGVVRTLFKVDDRYETYISKETGTPSKFIRNIDEGGYTKNKELTFYHDKKTVRINDKKNRKVIFERFESQVQDMLSAFYYLRNYDTSSLKTGDFIDVNIFMDEEEFDFKLKVLGRETKKTKFGSIKCIKIRPYVQSGRVFEAQESVTMWVTDDKNHIPVEVRAELTVGALSADIYKIKNPKYPINFKR